MALLALPVIITAAREGLRTVPKSLRDGSLALGATQWQTVRYTVLPVQIYNWTTRPQHAFQENAAAGIIVLLALLLTMNAVAIYLRNRYQKRLPI